MTEADILKSLEDLIVPGDIIILPNGSNGVVLECLTFEDIENDRTAYFYDEEWIEFTKTADKEGNYAQVVSFDPKNHLPFIEVIRIEALQRKSELKLEDSDEKRQSRLIQLAQEAAAADLQEEKE